MPDPAQTAELALPPNLPVRGPHLRVALCLGAAGIVATLLLFPYLMALMPQKFARLPLPWWAVMGAQALQAGVLCWLLGWLGLSLGAKYGQGAPWLHAALYRQPRAASTRSRWWLAALLGIGAALLVLLLQQLFVHHAGTATPHPHNASIDWAWRGALASFYGGIVEEVKCRLLLVSLLVWLLARTAHGRARPWMFVLAVLLAAVLFGAGHLPAAFAAGMHAAPLPILRIILLNAVAGIVFGALYCRLGLEHAMLAHFSADLVLHVLAPLAAMP